LDETTQAFPQIKVGQLKSLPIPTTDPPDRKVLHDGVVSLVDQMLALNAQLVAAKTDHEKAVLQRQIDATGRKIDELVYELYGLTDEEIRIVEEETCG
jgi:hypothetical protein